MRFKREGAWAYFTNSDPNSRTDEYADATERWESEYGYLQGVGEDGGENTIMITSNGSPGVSQAGSTPSAAAGGMSILDTITKSLQTLVPVAANVYQQKKLIELNQQRSMMGQPMLSAADYAAMYQLPTAQVTVGPNAAMKNALLIGGAVLLGLVGLRAAKII